MTRRGRRWATAAVIGAVLAALWVLTGQPWQPLAAGVAATVLVRLLTRVRAYQPARATLAGLLVAGLVLLADQSVWAWLLVGGTTIAATIGLAAPRPVALITDGRTATPVLTRAPRFSPLLHWRTHVALLSALVAVLGLVGVVQQYAAAQRQQAVQQQASALSRARLLSPSPARAARALLQEVAEDDPSACTTLLDLGGATQLAVTVAVTDCPAAVHALRARVLSASRYPQPDADTTPTTATGDIATADTCHMTWNALNWWTGRPPAPPAGPQIGRLTLHQVLGQGWVITDVQRC